MQVSELEKVAIGLFPTPLYKLERLSSQLKSNVFIKRDDLDGVAFGGNKIRKLEYLVKEALDLHCTTLLTYGGVQTNHGLQTAAVACRFGLRSIIIADMMTESPPEQLSGNLLLDAILDCEVVFLDVASIERQNKGASAQKLQEAIREAREEATRKVIKAHEAKGERVYISPGGGSSSLGCMGYFFAIEEIMKQLENMHQKIDYLFCAVGSAGTFSGLWLGSKYFGAPFQIMGIAVAPYSELFNLNAATLINETSRRFNLGINAVPEELHIFGGYEGKGYDIPDSQTFNAIYRLARTEGLFIDTVYTGKSFGGMLDFIEKEKIPSGSNVIFLHTGGAPALWTEHHEKALSRELWSNKEHMVISSHE